MYEPPEGELYWKAVSPVRSSSRQSLTRAETGSPFKGAKEVENRIVPPLENIQK